MSHIASSLLAKRRREQQKPQLQPSPSHDAMRRLELAINEADVACATLQDSLDNSLLDDTLHVNLSSTDIFGTRCVCCCVFVFFFVVHCSCAVFCCSSGNSSSSGFPVGHYTTNPHGPRQFRQFVLANNTRELFYRYVRMGVLEIFVAPIFSEQWAGTDYMISFKVSTRDDLDAETDADTALTLARAERFLHRMVAQQWFHDAVYEFRSPTYTARPVFDVRIVSSALHDMAAVRAALKRARAYPFDGDELASQLSAPTDFSNDSLLSVHVILFKAFYPHIAAPPCKL
jgi:hypothetical protein